MKITQKIIILAFILLISTLWFSKVTKAMATTDNFLNYRPETETVGQYVLDTSNKTSTYYSIVKAFESGDKLFGDYEKNILKYYLGDIS